MCEFNILVKKCKRWVKIIIKILIHLDNILINSLWDAKIVFLMMCFVWFFENSQSGSCELEEDEDEEEAAGLKQA